MYIETKRKKQKKYRLNLTISAEAYEYVREEAFLRRMSISGYFELLAIQDQKIKANRSVTK